MIIRKDGEYMTITKKKVVISLSLILFIVSVAVIVIVVLIGMGFGKLPKESNTDTNLSTDVVVDSIINDLNYSGISRVNSDNISKYYDLDDDLTSEATVYMSDSADSCFEISCFKLKDNKKYSELEASIKKHLNSQTPNLKKPGNSKIEYCDPYVLVVVSDNSESAVASFKSLVTKKSVSTKK